MFRARVAAQGFTVLAMVAGSMYYSKDREKTKELRKLNDERDAEVKRQKWIRELEVRDEEEKSFKARLQQRSEEIAQAERDAQLAENAGTGGILGRMGLWSQGQAAAEQNETLASDTEATTDKKAKNPKSSLGAIGEAIVTQKKDDGSKK